MKINTPNEYLSQDIYDIFHIFDQSIKLDEEKPFVNFNMQQDGQNLFMTMEIDYTGETQKFESFANMDTSIDKLQEKRYIKRAVIG